MKLKFGLVFALAAILLLSIGFVLAIRAEAGLFADSSVVPTVDEVEVGEPLGFALYVLNSGPVTATEVLVWNPLPPGTTYVSASGGAFPVVAAHRQAASGLHRRKAWPTMSFTSSIVLFRKIRSSAWRWRTSRPEKRSYPRSPSTNGGARTA